VGRGDSERAPHRLGGSLHVRPESSSKEQLDRAGPQGRVLPRKAGAGLAMRGSRLSPPPEPAPRWGGTCCGSPSRSRPRAPPHASTAPAHYLTRPRARGRSPSASCGASSPRTRHSGAQRAPPPPLTLRRSRPSPERPPGLRSPAAGVAVGGAGEARAGRGAAHSLHKAGSRRPVRRSLPLLKGRAPSGAPQGSRTGTGNDLSRLQPPAAPHRGARPGGPRGGGGCPARSPGLPAEAAPDAARIYEVPGRAWDSRRLGTRRNPPPEGGSSIWPPVRM
jgi:hypothetical protein